jgi:xanthosine utilization system XapX-like protein
MAQIDKLIAMMQQRQAERAVLISDKATRLFVQGQPMSGAPLTTPQLVSLLRESAPPEVQPQVGQENRVDWVYSVPQGAYSVSVTRLPDGLSATIVPLTENSRPVTSAEPTQSPLQDRADGNTGGEGASAEFPDELKGFNWGAFFLTVIWCAAHKAWYGLIVYLLVLPLSLAIGLFIDVVFATLQIPLPLAPVVMIIVAALMACLLASGANKIAWQNRRWESIEQFRAVQRIWAMWGAGAFTIYCLLLLWWVNRQLA